MVPVLYNKTDDFGFLGRGKLVETISCVLSESLNGQWEIELKYPTTGKLAATLRPGLIIAATVPVFTESYTSWKTRNTAWFDIYSRKVDENGIITVKASHCTRRLSHCIMTEYIRLYPYTLLGASYPARTEVETYRYDVDGMLFSIQANQAVVGNPLYQSPKSILGILIGSEGSFAADEGLELYAICGTTTRNGRNVPYVAITMGYRGQDRGANVHFGVNMLTLDYQNDMSSAYNAVIPYWDDGNGNLTYASGYVVKPTTPISPVIAVPLDCSSEFETTPTSAQLTTYARTFLDSNTPWTGTNTIKVDFVNDGVTITDADVQMGDTIHVYWGDADIATDLRVVAYDYDVLAERYISMELGTPQTQYVAVTGESYAGAGGSGGVGNSDYLFYDSVVDLGLESGSATISAAYSAMPNRAIFIGAASQFSASEVPNIYGIVQIIKFGDQRASIHFFGKQRGNADYRMFFTDALPSGLWIKDVLTFYTVAELGLTSGSATITQIWNAMPLQSRYIGGAGDIASSALPYSTAYGQVEIWKNTATNGYIFLHGLNASIGEWRMFLDNSGGSYAPSLTWVRLPGAVNAGTITKIDADTTDNGSSIKTDGHTAELHLMFRKSAGYTTSAYTDVFTVSPPPTTAVQQLVAQNSSYGLVIINTSGTVRVYPYSGTLSGHIRITVPYFV